MLTAFVAELELRYLDTTRIIINHLPYIERLQSLDCWKNTVRQIHIILQGPVKTEQVKPSM